MKIKIEDVVGYIDAIDNLDELTQIMVACDSREVHLGLEDDDDEDEDEDEEGCMFCGDPDCEGECQDDDDDEE